jgi:microsomal dipeptidase-like Zn-dependent dipeptidase
MKKNFLVAFVMIFFFTSLSAQSEINTYVDIHVNTSKKPYNSRSILGKYNLWETIFHECGIERSTQVMQLVGIDAPKHSQGNLERLLKGNTRLFCMPLSPLEQRFVNSSSLLTNRNKQATIACIYGVEANQLFLRRDEIDYFQDLVQNLTYVKRYENTEYYVNGIPYTFKIVRSTADLKEINSSENLIGAVMTIEGGHAFGHSIYINDKITHLKEYRELIIQNIDRLKGALPFSNNSDELLDIPILWVSLAKNYANGLGGTSNSFSRNMQTIFTRPTSINDRETALGIAVIDRLITKNKGRRILIDIKHMSLAFRSRYYKAVERSSILGDNIPIVCSHTGISGLKRKSSLYKKRDDDSKNLNSYLNHWQQNLSNEDVFKIVKSKGLIGITLDKTVLAGGLALQEIEMTFPNTVQRRTACVKLLMANMFTVIKVLAEKADPRKKNQTCRGAWSSICIGSDFDEMLVPLDPYKSAEDLPDLARDLQQFLERPTAIGDLFTVEDIKSLMGGLTPTEITKMVMQENAYNFIKNNLPKR